jgi:hypothetical protein
MMRNKKNLPEGYILVGPGEEIPEAQFWPNIDAYLNQRFVALTGEGKFIALKEQIIKRTPEKPKEPKKKEKKPKVKKPKVTEKPTVVADFDEELD